jgi:hypothetical protein
MKLPSAARVPKDPSRLAIPTSQLPALGWMSFDSKQCSLEDSTGTVKTHWNL